MDCENSSKQKKTSNIVITSVVSMNSPGFTPISTKKLEKKSSMEIRKIAVPANSIVPAIKNSNKNNDPKKDVIVPSSPSKGNAVHNVAQKKEEKKESSKNVNVIYSKVSNAGKDKFIGLKITNLNDLKKATPRVKLPSSIISSSTAKKTSSVSEEVKQKLNKYCRTCAGLKFPLVDIFSDKGIQMRLEQQIQHLENIEMNDNLSTHMCMDCICDMKMSYKFFMQIKKAEMKLQSIFDALDDSATKAKKNGDESKTKSDQNLEMSSDLIDISDEIKSELFDDDSYGMDEPFYEGGYNDFDTSISSSTNEIIETRSEEDPIETYKSIDNKVIEEDRNLETDVDKVDRDFATDLIEEDNNFAIDNINKDKNNESDESHGETHLISEVITKPKNVTSKEPKTPVKKNQNLRKPNLLKRKLSSGHTSDESAHSSKKSLKKFNTELKEMKIPKINMQNSMNIRTEEDGVMYVTAKGSKPNEVLLIKVKKVDKDKKEKTKKKSDFREYLKDDMCKLKGKYIDEQIEEYKKKREQILGQPSLIALDTDTKEEEPDIRAVSRDTSDVENCSKDEQDDSNLIIEIRGNEKNSVSLNLNKLPKIDSEFMPQFEKYTQRFKEIKNRHDSNASDNSEDCTERLKSLLRQKDEYINDFKNYLKNRRIVASRLKDEDIILLYEMKNNVVLERLPPNSENPENIDPFKIVETFDCDFCFKTFSDREMESEHSKTHDFKLMHFCEDCQEEFVTHKAKRSHNITCIQKLMCRYCDMILESKGKKRQHEQKHCDEQNGQLCDMCGEKFKHMGTLDQHVKAKHMQLEKIFKCPQCPKKFAFRTKLTFHLKSVHTTSRAFLCEDCGSDFKNPASLRHHRIRKHQPVNNKKECQVCHKMIPIYGMSKHMHTHKSYSIECPHCDKMFKNTSTLKQHLRIHEDQRQYKCDLCGVGFNRRDGLRLHLRVHEKVDSKGLKECSCQVCGEKFPNHSMLVIHRNRTHKDGRNYTCHICNRSMISTRSLEWHMSHIHNQILPGIMKDESSVDMETKRVSCAHCDKTFKTEMILRTHVKNTHTEKEPMKCQDCEEMFTSDVRLRHHMMVNHNRLEGTIICPHCPKRFVNQLRLKTHMISHSDERPHTCDVCGFMLKTKIQLIKHKQNRHSNERPLQCRYCSWRCKQVSALVCHERTHTNERPYSCSVCKQRFKYLGDKNKHERRHESLGGSGFKRIVTSRGSNKVAKKKEDDSTEQESDQEHEMYEHMEEMEHERMNSEIETFDDSQIVKFEEAEMVDEESDTSFKRVFIQERHQESNDDDEVVIGMEETAVYTEEVTTDEIITDTIIDPELLQPGTVVHLQQEDENGKIQVIPVMLSLPDLTDGSSDVSLTTATIMYNN